MRRVLTLWLLIGVEGCTCEVPRVPCTADVECPETYSCVGGLCQPCTGCAEGERCAAGVCVPDLNVLAFTSAGQSVLVGSCSEEVRFQSKNVYGRPFVPNTAVAVTLTSSSTTLTFFSDAACTSALTTVIISAGTSEGGFYFRGSAPGTRSVGLTATGFAGSSQTETIAVGAPEKLVFTTAAQSRRAGQCSNSVTLQVEDAAGNRSAPAASTDVALSASSVSMAFYSDPACSTAITTLNFGPGTDQSTFYFRDTVVGTPTLTASFPGLTSATQVETLTPGTAAKLVFTNAPITWQSATCSPAATLQVRDAFDNNATVSVTATVGLGAVPAGLTFYRDAACAQAAASVTINIGQGTQTFYLRSAAVGTWQVTVSAAGLTPAVQTETAISKSLGFTTAAQLVTAGDCSGVVTVQTRDGSGSPEAVTADLTVSLTASTMLFYSDAACTLAVTGVTVTAGTDTASFYVKDNTSGTRTVNASAPGYAGASQAQTVSPGAPSQLVFTTALKTLLASACSSAVTVETRDSFGNPTTAGATVDLSVGVTPAELTTTLFSDAACTTTAANITIAAASSAGSFYFRTRTGGPVTVTAASTGLTSANQAETVVSTSRSGACTINNGSTTSANCTIAPALFNRDRTILFFGASTTAANGQDANVRCVLTNTTTVTCDRVGTATTVNVQWHTVEFPVGAGFPLVRHISQACGGTLTTLTISPALTSVTDSFVLFSSTRNSGNGQNITSARIARLSNSTQATVEYTSGNCNGDLYSLQVVEYPGANVAVGNATNLNTVTTTLSAPAADLTRSFLLLTSRSGDDAVCSRALKGSLSAVDMVTVSRGAGASCVAVVPEIHFQRVELPVGNVVQQVPFSLAAAAGSNSQTITAVDLTRSAIFSAGQLTSGQAWGESAYSTGELFAEALGRHAFSDATTAQVTRESSNAAAAFNAFVVQFQP